MACLGAAATDAHAASDFYECLQLLICKGDISLTYEISPMNRESQAARHRGLYAMSSLAMTVSSVNASLAMNLSEKKSCLQALTATHTGRQGLDRMSVKIGSIQEFSDRP
jgi:hypothetical protein